MIPFILFAAFVTVPVIEIALFIQVGGLIGLWPTLLTVVLTAFIGTTLLRMQGLKVLADAQNTLNQGGMPIEPAIHGVFLLISGLTLLTPGFMTDAIGLILFIPPVRLWLGRPRWRAPCRKPRRGVGGSGAVGGGRTSAPRGCGR